MKPDHIWPSSKVDLFSGKGKYNFADRKLRYFGGFVHKGDFKDNLAQGVFVGEDGSRYKEKFRCGKRNR